MARITTYALDNSISDGDKLIGTDADNNDITKNFTLSGVAEYVIDKLIDPDATDFHIPVFNQNGIRITDSIMHQDSSVSNGTAGTQITIDGSLLVNNNATVSLNLSVAGESYLSGNVYLGDDVSDAIKQRGTLEMLGPVKDSSGTLGGNEQVLVSNASGVLSWENYQGTGLEFQSAWDADTNVPDLTAITLDGDNTGKYWVVSVEGTTDLSGITQWSPGDWAIISQDNNDNVFWSKVDNSSVDGVGTKNTIAMWTSPKTLGDSPITNPSSGNIKIEGNLTLPQYGYLYFGSDTNNQLFLSNSLSGSQLRQTGTGTLEIQCESELSISASAAGGGTESLAKFSENGPIELYYDNVKRFATTSGGVDIIGGVNVTGSAQLDDDLSVDGESSFNDDATFEGTANFQSAVLDQTSNAGTAGQVLSSTGANVEWVDPAGVTSTSSSTNDNLLGIKVTPTTGAVTIGLDIDSLATSTLPNIDEIFIPYYDEADDINRRVAYSDLSSSSGAVKGTGTTNTLPIWSDGPNGVLGDSGISEAKDVNGNITDIKIATTQAASPLSINFGTGGTISFKKGATEFIKLADQAGGFYNSQFRYGDRLTVDRDFSGLGASLDVGDPANFHPAASFRNGVVISNNPSGVQVDNTSMVIGSGNNDIVSGSDNCLAIGNGNQILNDSDNSLAVGQGNIIRNNSDNSFSIGQGNIIDGTGATSPVRSQVLGYQNSLTGSFSSFIAGGQNTVTTNQNAVALGFSHTLSGDDSMFAFGENNTGPSGATDNNSFMIGGNLTGVDGNMALGFRNDTSSYPATDYSNGLGNTKFALAVGSTLTTNSNALLITEGGVARSGVWQIPRIILPQQETLDFTSDADATAGGIPTGGLYRNGNELRINFNNTEAPGNEGLTILTPHFQVATPGGSDTYTELNNIVDFDWSGGSGTYEYILPSATAVPYRKIRFVNNSTISASTKVHITAPTGETIDGGAFYEINKAYNGCAVWSDGVQWIVIQAKAS